MDVMLKVNGVAMPPLRSFKWGLNDVSDAKAGRTEDALMHKNRIAQKRKLELSWVWKTWQEASLILRAFNPEYIEVFYPDIMDGRYETRTFYRGDPNAPVYFWNAGDDNLQRIETISFNIIER